MIYLRDRLTPESLTSLQEIFSDLNLSETELRYYDRDGEGKVIASYRGSLFSAPNVVWFDRADLGEGDAINPHSIQGLALCHELIHLRQYRRGFWTRLSMWWARRTQKYPEPPDYDKGQWHEVEAHRDDEVLWRKWID